MCQKAYKKLTQDLTGIDYWMITQDPHDRNIFKKALKKYKNNWRKTCEILSEKYPKGYNFFRSFLFPWGI